MLLQDFVCEVPRQQQAIVWLIFDKPRGVTDLQSRPGGVKSLFDRASVHHVIEDIRADSKVIQQGASLCRCPIYGDAFPLRLQICQQPRQALTQRLDASPELTVDVVVSDPGRFFLEQFGHGRLYLRGGRVSGEDSQRPAVNGQTFDIHDRQAMLLEQPR